MELTAALFYILAVLAGVSAIAVVVTQNIVRAATWLLFALAATAGIFFLLGATFIGATQLLIYVGGTLVLVVFGVMLTAQGPFITMRIGAAEWAVALCVGLLFYAMLAFSLHDVQSPTRTRHRAPGEQLPDALILGGGLLGMQEVTPHKNITGRPEPASFQRRRQIGYLLPFEIVSVHLLVVLVGAAYLARAKRRRIPPPETAGPTEQPAPSTGAPS